MFTLSNDALVADVIYESPVNPRPCRHALWFALTHFFNHQTHHRGQLTSLLAQRGMDPGVTDLIGFPDAPQSAADHAAFAGGQTPARRAR